jgi:uncharacterized protein (TIGR03086 family)
VLEKTVSSVPPVGLYRAAAADAVATVEAIRPEQLTWPTPCRDWTVQHLVDHLTNGTEYLRAAVEGRPARELRGVGLADFGRGVQAALLDLDRPGALDRTCRSPLGFEWSVGEAVAGTFMDVLIHSWDLAGSCGQDETLDSRLVEACIDMFLPAMPELGRAAGLVGPAVDVGPGATPQARLLGAMGRRP